MKTTIYLIRHGQTVWNQEHRMQGSKNSPLTETGIHQAECLRDHLTDVKLNAIFTSDSQRAQETTHHVFPQYLPHVEPAFTEINMGIWEGQEHSIISSTYPEAWNAFFNEPLDYTPIEGGETFKDVYNRVVPRLDEIIKTHEGECIAIVSHRITLKVIVHHLMGLPYETLGEEEDFLSTSLTKIVINDENKPTLVIRSDISHYE